MSGAWEECNLPGLDVPRRQAQLGLGNGTKPGAWEPKLQPGLFGQEGARADGLLLPETVPWVRYDSTGHRSGGARGGLRTGEGWMSATGQGSSSTYLLPAGRP